MKKCLMSHCFTSTVILKDFLNVLLPILQSSEDEINLITITSSNVQALSELFQLRNDILCFLEVICDYEFSINGLSNFYFSLFQFIIYNFSGNVQGKLLSR